MGTTILSTAHQAATKQSPPIYSQVGAVYMTTADAAKVIGKNSSIMYSWAIDKSGPIQAVKISAHDFGWRRADVEEVRKRIPKKTPDQIRRSGIAQAAGVASKLRQAVPSCATKSDKSAIVDLYIKAIEMSQDGEKYSIDHIYPINGQRYGVCGLHVIGNLSIVPLYNNMDKSNKPHHTWEHYFDLENT
jgi:hypothetical protein